jgi:hypothetical protein
LTGLRRRIELLARRSCRFIIRGGSGVGSTRMNGSGGDSVELVLGGPNLAIGTDVGNGAIMRHSLARRVPCVNLWHRVAKIVRHDLSELPAALSPKKQRQLCIDELTALGPNPKALDLMAAKARYTPYVWWQVQQLLAGDSESLPEYMATKDALRARVTNRLLMEAETAEEAKDRIQALGKLLASCDARDTKTKPDPISEQTEDAVRAELRDPQPRLVELMIEEWCDSLTQDEMGETKRPAIRELVRRLLPLWEDVLAEEGWVRE